MADLASFVYEHMSDPPLALTRRIQSFLYELFPDKYVLYTEDSSASAYHFASEGNCKLREDTEFRNQWEIKTRWDSSGKAHLGSDEFVSFNHIEWQAKQLSILSISTPGKYNDDVRYFIIGANQEVCSSFYLALVEWRHRLKHQIFEFAGGCWKDNEVLFHAIKTSSFDNLVLDGDLKERVQRDVEQFLNSKAVYQKHKLAWKRGIILTGPPGNGKTHTVRSILNRFELPGLYVREFKSEYGEETDNIRKVFARARLAAPCFLIFEDVDALITPETRSVFLNELDGFASNEGIYTIATTNYPERIDSGLLNRPSRFDRKYAFELPSEVSRRAYLVNLMSEVDAELLPTDDQINDVAKNTEGFSFAYLKELFLVGLMQWIDAEQAGTPLSLGESMILNAKQLLHEQVAEVKDESGVPNQNPRNAAMRRAIAASRRG